jgi:hypothetical protein
MWPFGSKPELPEPIMRGDLTARCDAQRKGWIIDRDGIEFYLPGLLLDESAFDWVKEAASTVDALDAEMRARVMDCLVEWPCDKTQARISCVYLDEYPGAKTINVDFLGDESWGDLGVHVIISDGKIVNAYGED